LRSNGILSVVITGQVTQGCVESAVRTARDLDFYTAMVQDCIASTKKEFHDNTMENLGARMPTPDSEELMKLWK
jgi:ureidoacrylate peracid hydrolase